MRAFTFFSSVPFSPQDERFPTTASMEWNAVSCARIEPYLAMLAQFK
jgi:hypothetical protein